MQINKFQPDRSNQRQRSQTTDGCWLLAADCWQHGKQQTRFQNMHSICTCTMYTIHVFSSQCYIFSHGKFLVKFTWSDTEGSKLALFFSLLNTSDRDIVRRRGVPNDVLSGSSAKRVTEWWWCGLSLVNVTRLFPRSEIWTPAREIALSCRRRRRRRVVVAASAKSVRSCEEEQE